MLFTFFFLQNIDQNERIHKAVKNNSAQIEKQKRQVRVKNIPNHTISAAPHESITYAITESQVSCTLLTCANIF